MNVAVDSVTIWLGQEDFDLRPSLRHALMLSQRTGGLGKLANEIRDGSYTAALAVIEPQAATAFIENKVFNDLESLTGPLMRYIALCAGIDPDDLPTEDKRVAKGQAKSVPVEEYLADLYRKATGWLGWTPDTALDATPAQIMEALKGRQELLTAVFGAGDATTKHDPRAWDEKARDFFAGRTVKAA